MGYKSILVYVDGGKGHEAVIETGLGLADAFDAHVTGLNVYLPSYQAYAYYGEFPAWDGGAMEREDEEARLLAERLHERFKACCQRFGSISTCEWRFMQSEIAQGLALNARYADLVVMGHKEPGDELSRGSADLPAQVALASSRPVLVTPGAEAAQTVPGRHILLAWNASREATRAATAALPLLKRAERVTVVVVHDGRRMDSAHGDEPGADIALYLARHGVATEVNQLARNGAEVSEVLLRAVAEQGADLLCMGAYGHSRLRELVLGGTTRDVLRRMSVPTLLAC